jgi:hypothetical protein
LHWAEHLPREQHFQFQPGCSDRILNIGLLYLLGDLKRGLSAYLADLQGDASLQANYRLPRTSSQKPTAMVGCGEVW